MQYSGMYIMLFVTSIPGQFGHFLEVMKRGTPGQKLAVAPMQITHEKVSALLKQPRAAPIIGAALLKIIH